MIYISAVFRIVRLIFLKNIRKKRSEVTGAVFLVSEIFINQFSMAFY